MLSRFISIFLALSVVNDPSVAAGFAQASSGDLCAPSTKPFAQQALSPASLIGPWKRMLGHGPVLVRLMASGVTPSLRADGFDQDIRLRPGEKLLSHALAMSPAMTHAIVVGVATLFISIPLGLIINSKWNEGRQKTAIAIAVLGSVFLIVVVGVSFEDLVTLSVDLQNLSRGIRQNTGAPLYYWMASVAYGLITLRSVRAGKDRRITKVIVILGAELLYLLLEFASGVFDPALKDIRLFFNRLSQTMPLNSMLYVGSVFTAYVLVAKRIWSTLKHVNAKPSRRTMRPVRFYGLLAALVVLSLLSYPPSSLELSRAMFLDRSFSPEGVQYLRVFPSQDSTLILTQERVRITLNANDQKNIREIKVFVHTVQGFGLLIVSAERKSQTEWKIQRDTPVGTLRSQTFQDVVIDIPVSAITALLKRSLIELADANQPLRLFALSVEMNRVQPESTSKADSSSANVKLQAYTPSFSVPIAGRSRIGQGNTENRDLLNAAA